MFSNKVRYLLTFLNLALGSYAFSRGFYYYAVLLFLAALVIVYGYFRYNAVWLAFNYMRSQRIQKVRELINDVKYPHLLAKTYKGYYHMLRAAIKLYLDNDLQAVPRELETALSHGVTSRKTSNNISIIYLMFTQLHMRLEQWDEARHYLKMAKDAPHNPSLDVGINGLEKEVLERERGNPEEDTKQD